MKFWKGERGKEVKRERGKKGKSEKEKRNKGKKEECKKEKRTWSKGKMGKGEGGGKWQKEEFGKRGERNNRLG